MPPDFGSANKKTLSACLEIHSDYFREYPPEEDFLVQVKGDHGKSAVEFSFALPIPDVTPPYFRRAYAIRRAV